MKILYQVKHMLWKDLILEVRRPSELGAALVFALSSAALVGYVASRVLAYSEVAIIVGLALVEVFLAIFTALMSFVRESDRGTIDGIRLSPVEPVVIYISKLAFTLMLLELLTLAFIGAALFFAGGLVVENLGLLIAIALASGLYLSSVSAFASAISIYIEARGIMLPTIILVLSLPMLQNMITVEIEASTRMITLLLLSGTAFMMITSWLSRYLIEV